MPLVDYSSDSSSSSPSSPPPPSSPSSTKQQPQPQPKPKPPPPPLPASFHDLYASTVRQSPIDTPALHHGRRRQTPHVAGNWPSHIYITWRPSEPEQALLSRLVARAAATLIPTSPTSTSASTSSPAVKLYSFLEDEIGVPLPLHISLSRPIVLTTATKEAFLERAVRAVRQAGAQPFAVTPRRLAWFHSPDSDRTFLVLQVETRSEDGRGRGRGRSAARGSEGGNKELSKILVRCNAAVRAFGQPELYAAASKDEGGVDACAFHISIAWVLGNPTGGDSGVDEGLVGRILEDEEEFGGIKDWEIKVEDVKVKIGNVVTNVQLRRHHDHVYSI